MFDALWDHGAPTLQWAVVIAASLVATVTDLAHRKIPNALTFPVFLVGLAWATCAAGFAGLADSAAGSLLLALPYVILFAVAGGGAGDAKLMAAVGAWLGLANALLVLLCVSCAAIAMALIISLFRRQMRELLIWLGIMLRASLLRLKGVRGPLPQTGTRQTMPYAPAIFLGICIAAWGVLVWQIRVI